MMTKVCTAMFIGCMIAVPVLVINDNIEYAILYVVFADIFDRNRDRLEDDNVHND